MFVGIRSGAMVKDAVVGTDVFASNKGTAAAAAAELAQSFGFEGEVEVRPHASRAYQSNVAVAGNVRFRLIDASTAPAKKVPSGITI